MRMRSSGVVFFLIVVIGSGALEPFAVANAQRCAAVFDTPGEYTWTAPEQANEVRVQVWGAGGAGGTGYKGDNTYIRGAGGGGGGGGYADGVIQVTPGTTYDVVVGKGGRLTPHANDAGVEVERAGNSEFGITWQGNPYAVGAGGGGSGGMPQTGTATVGAAPVSFPGLGYRSQPYAMGAGNGGIARGGGGGGGGYFFGWSKAQVNGVSQTGEPGEDATDGSAGTGGAGANGGAGGAAGASEGSAANGGSPGGGGGGTRAGIPDYTYQRWIPAASGGNGRVLIECVGEPNNPSATIADDINCSDPSQVMFRMYAETNSHIAQHDIIDAPVEICYDDLFDKQYHGNDPWICDSNTLIRSSAAANAHAEDPNLATQEYQNFCYGDLSCTLRESDCIAGETKVVTLSSRTNAHASLNGYDYTLCCSPKKTDDTQEPLEETPWCAGDLCTYRDQCLPGEVCAGAAKKYPDGSIRFENCDVFDSGDYPNSALICCVLAPQPPIQACQLTSFGLSLDDANANGLADPGETISVQGSVNNAALAAESVRLRVEAWDSNSDRDGAECILEEVFPPGLDSGILSWQGNAFTGEWKVPDTLLTNPVSSKACGGVQVTARRAMLLAADGSMPCGEIDSNGEFTFATDGSCQLLTAQIELAEDNTRRGFVDEGDIIRISGTMDGECHAARRITLFASDNLRRCQIQPDGQMDAIETAIAHTADSTYTGSWTVPEVPTACMGMNVRPTKARLSTDRGRRVSNELTS